MKDLLFERFKAIIFCQNEMLNFIVSFDLDPFFSYLSVDGLDLGHFLHEEMSFRDREEFFVDILIIAEAVHGFNFIKVINFI